MSYPRLYTPARRSRHTRSRHSRPDRLVATVRAGPISSRVFLWDSPVRTSRNDTPENSEDSLVLSEPPRGDWGAKHSTCSLPEPISGDFAFDALVVHHACIQSRNERPEKTAWCCHDGACGNWGTNGVSDYLQPISNFSGDFTFDIRIILPAPGPIPAASIYAFHGMKPLAYHERRLRLSTAYTSVAPCHATSRCMHMSRSDPACT
ncbi:hypothetical protein L226DRAFT_111385 [Lentinus tigrinus ALCF2SS1-7]|uniref:uncharacterized protein n=1 Tax=Lentinus tigrinus ALCF2SS1-7 TaxID=1328758 RepID=UPI0011664008|nr:hypothetical protein L226DRAFT_111385 [Lentinus tigrinus ALCF2SS1-7]